MKTLTVASALLAFVFATMCSGCFREHRQTVQTADVASLVFKGNVEGTTIQLVDEAGKAMTEPFAATAETTFSVPSGTAILIVRRGSEVAVKRKLFLVAGQTREVWIP